MPNRAKIVFLACLLLQGLAGQYVWASLAHFSATRANVTVILTDKSSNSTNVNTEPPKEPSPQSPSDSFNSYCIVVYPNGTRVLELGANITIPKGCKAEYYTSSSATLSMQASSEGFASYTIVDYHYPFWTFWENVFDLLRDINSQLNFVLLCAFCALELRKRRIWV
jgi:hypothetical protein